MGMVVRLSKWGNSKGLRIPAEIIRVVRIKEHDELYIEAASENSIVITKMDTPRKGTLEYLFKDYDGESFKTELFDLGDPVGEEKW
ncbi:MAG: AbrB/MazE/SpoVT family DNA-binding domain-containing protein [Clostridiales Family XIII bacterium]|jgi:antitoxin MazE|nr:AbrB/MazE/SpoVT family DNA-binding domain-containing protein [Clostridiales Family XIII bacterium]